MPKSRNRYSRTAMRAKYRKPKRRRGGSMGWNVAIATVVIIGVVAIILTRSGSNDSLSNSRPLAANQTTGVAGDHWHTYLGVNICGEWINPAPAFEKAFESQSALANAGIHSHGDGLIHTHPFVTSEQGSNATLGHFLSNGGWSVSEDSLDISGGYSWVGPPSAPNFRSMSDGDKCTFGDDKGKKGELVWSVDGKMQKGNPSDYKVQDGATVAIGFLPKGAELGFPPGACDAFANITDQNSAAILTKNSPCQADTTTTTTTAPATNP
jgi:hypothetical protein